MSVRPSSFIGLVIASAIVLLTTCLVSEAPISAQKTNPNDGGTGNVGTCSVAPFNSLIGDVLGTSATSIPPNRSYAVEVLWTNDGHTELVGTVTSDAAGNTTA